MHLLPLHFVRFWNSFWQMKLRLLKRKVEAHDGILKSNQFIFHSCLNCQIICLLFFTQTQDHTHVPVHTHEIYHPLWRPLVDNLPSGLMGRVRILPAGDEHAGPWLGLAPVRKQVCAEGGVELSGCHNKGLSQSLGNLDWDGPSVLTYLGQGCLALHTNV